MRLGELRDVLAANADLPDETIIAAAVEDDSGNYVDQGVARVEPTTHEGEPYLYIWTRER